MKTMIEEVTPTGSLSRTQAKKFLSALFKEKNIQITDSELKNILNSCMQDDNSTFGLEEFRTLIERTLPKCKKSLFFFSNVTKLLWKGKFCWE